MTKIPRCTNMKMFLTLTITPIDFCHISTLLAVYSRQVVISSPLSRAIETSLLIFGEEAQPPRGSDEPRLGKVG